MTATVEPRFNEPLYNEFLGPTNDILRPSSGKIYEKNLEMTKPLYSEHILSVPWPFVISTSTVLPSYNVLTVLNLNSFLSKMQEEVVTFCFPAESC